MIKPLNNYLRRHRRAALLFSGGLDSSLLLAAAAPALGPGLTAITFTGPHTVPGERPRPGPWPGASGSTT